jgi:hypothetical protein
LRQNIEALLTAARRHRFDLEGQTILSLIHGDVVELPA